MTPRAHERFRARLWSKVYAAMIAHRSGLTNLAAETADIAVLDFDKRFQAVKPTATRVSS